ncbi:MAG TPA: VTT domain-containing protein [Vicinamibacterales bacterium]|jgi:membrane protein YqaA with SNARE-associated domain
MNTAAISALVRSFGGVGLLVVTVADSSFVTIPGVADLLLVVLTISHHDRMLYYATMATVGSICGCFIGFSVTRKAGDALLRKRFSARKIDKALGLFKRYGAFAIVIPAVLPPPAPFQMFVWLAGVADMSPWTFGLSVTTGRGFRYFVEGILALFYGRQVLGLLNQHRLVLVIVVASLIVLGGISWFAWSRWRRAREA